MDEVVGERPEPRATQVADRREVRQQQERQRQQPRPTEPAVQRQAGGERRRALEPEPATDGRRRQGHLVDRLIVVIAVIADLSDPSLPPLVVGLMATLYSLDG